MNIARYILRVIKDFSKYGFKNKGLLTARSKTIYDVDYDHLKKEGVKLIIFDVDDTMSGYLDTIPEQTKKLLKKKSLDFKIAILSNGTPERKKELEELLKGLPIYIEKDGYKPETEGFKRIIQHFKLNEGETAMIGDRVTTDIWGAKSAGIRARILVEPFTNHFDGRKTPAIVRLVRWAEKKMFV
jgi:HAD superfamily phosphatase (TIGR01668 family)